MENFTSKETSVREIIGEGFHIKYLYEQLSEYRKLMTSESVLDINLMDLAFKGVVMCWLNTEMTTDESESFLEVLTALDKETCMRRNMLLSLKK